MKPIIQVMFAIVAAGMASCGSNAGSGSASQNGASANGPGQSAVQDTSSEKNVVGIAAGSKDHTTLVAAVKAAELVDALSNAGPFTVFAPTNAAFDKLPAGTVESLLKPENKEKLADILQYHVSLGVFNEDMFQEGQKIGQANSGNITMSQKDGKWIVNGKAHILGSAKASNGIVYIIDEVLLP